MTIPEAKKICDEFGRMTDPSGEEAALFIEAAEFLIAETKDPRVMMSLGGWYYERKEFDRALKYYELAAEQDYEPAFEGLGYIWYYGRTGACDYGKAFYYYEKGAKRGNPVCAYKIADMYLNGYCVEKDEAKYREIIEGLYDARPTIEDMRYYPLPEIFTRLARIRMEDGRLQEAEGLLLEAKEDLANRIVYDPFFGNFSIMKRLEKDLFEVRDGMIPDIDLFDLFVMLAEPAKIRFFCQTFRSSEDGLDLVFDEHAYTVESLDEDGGIVIRFDDGKTEHRYPSVDDFFEKALRRSFGDDFYENVWNGDEENGASGGAGDDKK